MLLFLGAHAVPGLEEWDGTTFSRVLDLPHGPAVVQLSPAPEGGAGVTARLRLTELRDLGAAVTRCRRMLDLDADPAAVDDVLGADPALAPIVTGAPGRRVPASPDAAELAIRAVLGQQVSVAGARTLTARVVTAAGTPLPEPVGTLTHAFPRPEALAEADLTAVGLTGARRRTVHALAAALAGGSIPSTRAPTARRPGRALLAVPGIGPWTAALVGLRGLADPDVWLPGDLALRKSLDALGSSDTDAATRWRPVAVLRRPAPLGARRALPLHPPRPPPPPHPAPSRGAPDVRPHRSPGTPRSRPRPDRSPSSSSSDADGRDVVLASGWTADIADLLPVVHRPCGRPAASGSTTCPSSTWSRSSSPATSPPSTTSSVRQRSGPFLQEAWEVLRTVPPAGPTPTPPSPPAAAARRPSAPRPTPAPATPRRCSCPATGCSAPTAASAASAGGRRSSAGCSTTRPPTPPSPR